MSCHASCYASIWLATEIVGRLRFDGGSRAANAQINDETRCKSSERPSRHVNR
jgi:hypothetical protein